MMIEDKLTVGQRVRLEALALANNTLSYSSQDEILAKAAAYETFIKEGKK